MANWLVAKLHGGEMTSSHPVDLLNSRLVQRQLAIHPAKAKLIRTITYDLTPSSTLITCRGCLELFPSQLHNCVWKSWVSKWRPSTLVARPRVSRVRVYFPRPFVSLRNKRLLTVEDNVNLRVILTCLCLQTLIMNKQYQSNYSD